MRVSERRERASEEAAAWWVLFRAGELPRVEREEFVDWLRESPLHVAEMLRVAKVNDSLEQFQGWIQLNADGPDDDENIVELPASPQRLPGSDVQPYFRQRPRLIAAGIAVLASIAIGLLIGFRASIIETGRGERRQVALADGSLVQVDPETRLRIAFDEHIRRVFLDRGRALFKIARNPERPFLVQVDDATVRVLGTAFGVERGQQGIVVTVLEGKVGVLGPKTSTKVLPAGFPRELLLTADQQVKMPASGSAEPVRRVDSERELAWAQGQLVFDNETVATVVEEFNRYNRVQLRVADGDLATRKVSAIFDASDLDSFIAFLQTEVPVHVARSNSEIILQ